MPAANVLIWLSAKPLLKLTITTSCGFILTKKGLFEPTAAKGAGQLLLNVFMPSLLFSKIVPGFTARNIAALGPLVLVACIYQLYGLLIAWIARKIFWVPRRFRNGILMAGACNNWGDMPTAVLMSITASAPFSSGDSDVAVAYISIYILIGFTALFPLGGYRLIARDFAGMEEEEDITVSMFARLRTRWMARREAATSADGETRNPRLSIEKDVEVLENAPRLRASRVSLNLTDASDKFAPQVLSTHTQSNSLPLSTNETTPTPQEKHMAFKNILASIWAFIVSLAIPPTISIIVGIVIAVVPQLRGLFIPLPQGSHVHIGTAPDGLPPLHVIFDTVTFIGGGSIPLSLMCLGSALARLEIPRPLRRAPLGAIASFSVLKMVLGPVVGVLIVEALTHHTNLIDPNDKVLRFVCMYLAGSPTATTQARVSTYGLG